ncbi:hypothetical protein C8Q76DRAFT_851946 [Earliella scabrosa]|nr:hypothetical protein C8Q76DRAFT_851946 [Earliella scabrosa]
MLSALSSTQLTPQALFNGPWCSSNRPSSLDPITQLLNTPAMQGKPMRPSASPNTRPRPFVASPNDMFRVYSYTPRDGSAGSAIVVTVQFTFMSTETTFLRIVVGNRALSTSVRASASKREGEWDLQATIPELDIAATSAFPPSTVPLTVQALNGSNITLDSLTFGKFTYTGSRATPSPLLLCKGETEELDCATGPNMPDITALGTASSSTQTHSSRRSSRPTSSGGSSRGRAINAPISSRDASSSRALPKKQSLIRARRAGSSDDDADSNYRAVLSMETATDTMAKVDEWDEDERRIGRRLVRFTRVQDGCTLHVVCEAIRPSEYTEGDTVVSCIYRPPDSAGPGDPPVSEGCITSVDVIFLLECLVGDIFNIEEKNRIRRNLEGFRPKTVSKNKAGTEEFFQKIMDFPAPKPRNIEKDVKVFDWAILPQALDKIISKYTLYPAVKKHDGSVTPPILESVGPQSSLTTPYSTSSSPAPEHSSSDPTFLYQQTAFSQSQFISGSLDPMDSSYMTASAFPSANAFDSFLGQSLPPSTTPSPAPLLSTPRDSPHVSSSFSLPLSSAGDHYLDSSQSLYPSSYSDQGAFGSGSAYGVYDLDFQRNKSSLSSAMHGSQQRFL